MCEGQLILSILESIDGGLDLALRGRAQARGGLPREVAATVRASASALPRRVEAFPTHPAVRAAWDREEQAIADRLWEALRAADEPLRALVRALGVPMDAERRPRLLLELQTPWLRDVPWELLALRGSAARPALGAVIARLEQSAGPAPAVGARLRHLVYAPDAEDPDMAQLLGGLARAADSAGIPLSSWRPGTLPAADPPTLDVLHVALHGRTGEDGIYLRISRDEEIPVHSFVQALAEVARRVALVALWSCHGLSPEHPALETLAGRLLAVGARAVLASTGPISTRWPGLWLSPFQECLARQLPLSEAAWLARDALYTSQRADHRDRVHTLRLHLGDPGWDPRLYWIPPGYPSVSPALADLLTRAYELAIDRRSGFVGLEHLLLVAGQDPSASGPLGALLAAPGTHLESTSRGLDVWKPRVGMASACANPLATPRLLAWGPALAAGAGPQDLWALAAETQAHLTQRGEDPWETPGSFQDRSQPREADAAPLPALTLDPPGRLEVVGGPEDGRVLEPLAGQVIGRHHDDPHYAPDLGLYARSPVEDRRLSRRHLQVLETGRVLLLRRGSALIRSGRRLPLPEGRRALITGDLLLLGDGTCLRARP